MTDELMEYVIKLFTGFLPEDLVEAYLKLLKAGGVEMERAADFLGSDDLVRKLEAHNMAHVVPRTSTAPATLQPASPDLAFHGVLADFQTRASELQTQIFNARRRFASVPQPARPGDENAEQMVQVLTDRKDIVRVNKHLINRADRNWMTLETHESDMRATQYSGIDIRDAVRRGVRIRAIYDTAFTEDPEKSWTIERSVADGEEAYVLATVPMKMQLVNETTVLLPCTRTGSVAVLFKDGPVPRAMRLFFELLCQRSTPLGSVGLGSEGPLDATERKILELMAAGKSDRAIANQVRQHPSTVRRHITEIRDRLGLKTTSRFAMGFAVGRSGWIGSADTRPQVSKDRDV